MSLSRLHSFLRPLGLAALLIAVSPLFSQQAPAAKDSAKPKPSGVPMLDAAPTLTIPLPKPGAESPKATTLESTPLPSLRPVPPADGAAKNIGSTTSEIGQFVVHGADLESRNFIAKICEETATQLSELLRDSDHFEIPIVISVKTPPNVSPSGPAVSRDVAELAFGGFRLQITIQVRPDFNITDFREELTFMLLAERVLRNHKQYTSTRKHVIPFWLLVGIKEAARYRNRSRPSAVFAAVFRTGKVYGIEEILETTPGALDTLSRSIYETSCCALVLALLEQPDGNLRMAKFLNALATESKTDREMLNKWFPGLNASKSSLNKWWSLQMANLATPTVFEALGPSETAKELDQALTLHYETTASDAPAVRVASADEQALNADAEKETKKRGFFGRLFGSSDNADEKPAKEESKAGNKAKPEPEPKPKPKVAVKKAQTDEQPEKSGFRLRHLFGFGSSKEDEEASKEKGKDKPKAEPKKEDKPKPEPKKEDKPKPEPKKEDKPKPEPKKEDKPKPEPKKEDKPKPEPKKEDKPKPEPKKEDAKKADTEKRPGFFGRMFGSSKEEDKPADKAKDSDKKKEEKPKAEPKKEEKKSKDDEKPSAAMFDGSLMLRMLGDATLPAFSLIADTASWQSAENTHFVAFLGFGKKKEAASDEDSSKKKDDKKKEEPKKKEEKKADKKEEPKKKEAKPEPKPEPKAEPKTEDKPKETPKPQPKKERLVSVTIPLGDYSRIVKRSDAKQIFGATVNNLNALSARAHPLFRPIIKEYAELVAEIAAHKAKDVEARLKDLRARRDQALAQAKAARDYVDFYEASESTEYSGLFDDYLRLPKTIDNEIPRRADAISKTLDELEKQSKD